jgi:hypothetical protein
MATEELDMADSWTSSEQPGFESDHGCLVIEAGNHELTLERAVKHA